jgi:hypothetical protein
MKRGALFLFALFLFLSPVSGFAQTLLCNDQHGVIPIPGTGLSAKCPDSSVVPPPPPPPSPGACSASQMSDVIGGKTLARACFGTIVFQNPNSSFAVKANVNFNGAMDLPTILSGGSAKGFMGMLSGAPFQLTVAAGTYVALPITPTVAGTIQFSANASFGSAGTISLSTRPGGFVQGQPGVICTQSTGGGLYASSAAGAQCPLLVGRTYYVNFAGVDVSGNQVCAGNAGSDCSSVYLAYVEYTRAL